MPALFVLKSFSHYSTEFIASVYVDVSFLLILSFAIQSAMEQNPLTPLDDLISLVYTLYQLATGRLPFKCPNNLDFESQEYKTLMFDFPLHFLLFHLSKRRQEAPKKSSLCRQT